MQQKTVLVVDDEPTVRMLITEVLEELGYIPVEAADGAAALRVMQSDMRIDLLITDVGLPNGMNAAKLPMLAEPYDSTCAYCLSPAMRKMRQSATDSLILACMC